MSDRVPSLDFTPVLRPLMQRVGVASFKALGVAAGVSENQIRQIRRGAIAQVRLEALLKLSQALQISLSELLDHLHPEPVGDRRSGYRPPAAALQSEYDRLLTQLAQQQISLHQDFQQRSLQTLESLILQLPTALHAAQQNPQMPAVKLLPLLRPIDQLLGEWGIVAIAPVGSVVAYNPSHHELLAGIANPGDSVTVRYTGYFQGDRVLYRAKVSPVA